MSTSDHRQPADAPAREAPEVDSGDPGARIGQVIDERYRVLEFIGQGGMGSVYRGEHVTIRRQVALKLLHPSLAQIPEIGRRFEREAFAIGRIDHPNCVNVSDFGKLEDGSLFLVMEFLRGESLGDLLYRIGRVPPARALHVLRHVLRGLRHAHRAGIVHRDVKPENVVLVEHDDDPDFAKVLDFGIAKLLGAAETEDGGENLTQAGITFGTPAYLSPEQAVGEPADPRSDLYAATVVLYEMIAGRPPFQAEDKIELLAMHTSRPPPPLSETAPDLGVMPELEELLQRGLAKRKDDRFPDADAYIAAIDALLPGEAPAPGRPGSVPPAPRPGPLTPLPRRTTSQPGAAGTGTSAHRGASPSRARTVGIVALSLAGLLALAFFVLRDRTTAEPSVPVLPESAEGVVQEAEEKLALGDPDESLEVLKKKKKDLEDNGEAQLQLGHILSTKSEYGEALGAYLRAVELDDSLGEDAKMRANLQLMIDDRGPVFPRAARLLYEHASDPKVKDEAKERLLAVAAGKNPKRRHRAFGILEELGLGEQIDRVASFSFDLRQGKTCEERREAVAKLRALGDKRAIPALKRARWRAGPKRRGGRRRNANRCLRQPAQDAIKYLRRLPDGDPAVDGARSD